MKAVKFLAFVIFCTLLTNCATIIHGDNQEISFSSYPSGAAVSLNGKPIGKTPTIQELERRKEYIVKIELAGYKPYEMILQRNIDPWILGNIISWNLPGFIIDAATGSMFELTPDEVYAELKKGDGALLQKAEGTILPNSDNNSIKKDNTVYIAVVLKADPNWNKIGTLQKITD